MLRLYWRWGHFEPVFDHGRPVSELLAEIERLADGVPSDGAEVAGNIREQARQVAEQALNLVDQVRPGTSAGAVSERLRPQVTQLIALANDLRRRLSEPVLRPAAGTGARTLPSSAPDQTETDWASVAGPSTAVTAGDAVAIRPEQGWKWLDQARGLAVPTEVTRTERADWRAAEPGPGRNYAVHLPTGMIAVAMEPGTGPPFMFHEVSGGWLPYGNDLLHLADGVALHDTDASIGLVNEEQLAHPDVQAGLEGVAAFSREELLDWLASRGGLASASFTPATAAVTVSSSRQTAQQFVDQHPDALLGMTRDEAVEALEAVLEEAAGRRGASQDQDRRNALVSKGLTLLPLVKADTAYTLDFAGMRQEQIRGVFTVTGAVTGLTGPGNPIDTSHADPGASADRQGPIQPPGQASGAVMFPPGSRFEMVEWLAPAGRLTIELRHPPVTEEATLPPGTGGAQVGGFTSGPGAPADARSPVVPPPHAQWRRENPWWSEESGEETRDGQRYSPTGGQRHFLDRNRLAIRSVDDDGDRIFAAVTRTVPLDEIRQRIHDAAVRANIELPRGEPDQVGWLLREAADRAAVNLALPGPGEEVTGQHLRLFLAYLVERWLGNWGRAGMFVDEESAEPDDLTRRGLVEALRRLTKQREPYGDLFREVIAYFLDLPLQVLRIDGSVVLLPRANADERTPHTVVLINEHYLATVRRPDSAGESSERDDDTGGAGQPPAPQRLPRPVQWAGPGYPATGAGRDGDTGGAGPVPGRRQARDVRYHDLSLSAGTGTGDITSREPGTPPSAGGAPPTLDLAAQAFRGYARNYLRQYGLELPDNMTQDEAVDGLAEVADVASRPVSLASRGVESAASCRSAADANDQPSAGIRAGAPWCS